MEYLNAPGPRGISVEAIRHIPDKTADDFSPSRFLGCAFAGAALLSLLLWGAKDVQNLATVRDLIHVVNSSINLGRDDREYGR